MSETTSQLDISAPVHATPNLKRNAVGLGGAVIISAALMGPAVSMYFNPQLVASGAGAATPFVFLLALVIMAIVSSSIREMSREFPSAGSFYTYVTRGIGPRSGFVTGGLIFVAYALLIPAELALIGYYASGLLQNYGIGVPWWIITAIFAILMVTLSLNGISGSIKTTAVLFGIEVAIILVLSIIVVASGGAHGISVAPLNPASSPTGLSGIAFGLTFAILSFVGFEAATTLGEEVRKPRRNVPLAVLLSLVLVGALYVVVTFAEISGFGTSPEAIKRLIADPAPFTTLAANFAPWMQLLVGLAGVSSIFASAMSTNNGVVRIVFAMGREGLLPKSLGNVNPKHHTPNTAIWFVGIFSAVLAFGVSIFTGPFNTYAYLGAILTLAIIAVYVLTAVASIRYFSTIARARRSVIKHIVLPIVGVAALMIPLVAQFYPLPAAPYNVFPYIIILLTVVISIVAVTIGRRRPDVLLRAGTVLAVGDAVLDDSSEPAVEVA